MQAIFFDLDGTLVELPTDFEALFESALREHGVQADSEYHECYTDAFFEYLGECHPEPYRAGMSELCAEFDLEPSAEALADDYTERETAATERSPDVREVLSGLDSPLGVLTNGGVRSQRRKLEYHGIAEHFEAVVISGEVGAGKPDPEIFRAAESAIPAHEYVFVADDLERDVLPAQDAGFTGIYLADEDAAVAESEADTTVTSLHEIPDLLN